MHTLEPTGIYVSGPVTTYQGFTEASKLIPYQEIKGELKKLNLAEEIITGWNLLKPGLSEKYMGVEGDPLHVMMIAAANERLRQYRSENPA
jgi:hypothetical protein